MARHGENIRRRSDGRWEGRYKTFNEGKGKYIYRSVYDRNYEGVKEKLCKARLGIIWKGKADKMPEAEIDENRLGNAGNRAVAFSQAAEEWLTGVSGSRKYSTYVKYCAIYQTHLAETVGSCRLSIDGAEKLLEKISGCISGRGLSESLQRSIVCVVNQILSFANVKYSSGLPLLGHLSPKARKKAVTAFSKVEQAKILKCIYGKDHGEIDKFMAATLLCLHAGLRLGEICSLRWMDVDLDGMTLTVSRTVQRIAMPGHKTKTILWETAPKSESSKRTLPLMPEFVEILLRFKEDEPYVFGGEKLLDPRTMQYRFQKILKEADVEGKNFHALRHTFATNCIENGMDVKALSDLLGHSDVRITLNCYVHPTMDLKRKQIEALSDYYGQICGQQA